MNGTVRKEIHSSSLCLAAGPAASRTRFSLQWLSLLRPLVVFRECGRHGCCLRRSCLCTRVFRCVCFFACMVVSARVSFFARPRMVLFTLLCFVCTGSRSVLNVKEYFKGAFAGRPQ